MSGMTGGMTGGDMPAGDMPAGDMPAGDMPAGDMPAGDMPAGDCGIESPTARSAFAAGPLPFIVASCVDAQCHDIDFRNEGSFRLSFSEPADPSGFSEAQIDEALNVVEPRITPGDGQGSRLSGRAIDNHGRDGDYAAGHQQLVEWIDSLLCD